MQLLIMYSSPAWCHFLFSTSGTLLITVVTSNLHPPSVKIKSLAVGLWHRVTSQKNGDLKFQNSLITGVHKPCLQAFTVIRKVFIGSGIYTRCVAWVGWRRFEGHHYNWPLKTNTTKISKTSSSSSAILSHTPWVNPKIKKYKGCMGFPKV